MILNVQVRPRDAPRRLDALGPLPRSFGRDERARRAASRPREPGGPEVDPGPQGALRGRGKGGEQGDDYGVRVSVFVHVDNITEYTTILMNINYIHFIIFITEFSTNLMLYNE